MRSPVIPCLFVAVVGCVATTPADTTDEVPLVTTQSTCTEFGDPPVVIGSTWA